MAAGAAGEHDEVVLPSAELRLQGPDIQAEFFGPGGCGIDQKLHPLGGGPSRSADLRAAGQGQLPNADKIAVFDFAGSGGGPFEHPLQISVMIMIIFVRI